MIVTVSHHTKQDSDNEFISYIRIPEQKYRDMNRLIAMNGPEIYQKYGLKRDESITYIPFSKWLFFGYEIGNMRRRTSLYRSDSV